MANLTHLHRWEPYWPNLGANLELPEGERLTLLVASGLTQAQLVAMGEALRAVDWTQPTEAKAAALAEAYADAAKVKGAHVIAGHQCETLAQYLAAILDAPGSVAVYALRELSETVMEYNSVEGSLELFYARQSGGSPTTGRRPAAKGDAATGAR